MTLPTGEQIVLRDGRQEAIVCEVGATLRRYEVDRQPVCWGFEEDAFSTGGRGQVLAPWPNRLKDGTYVHDGIMGQAPLDEPERRNAIHGLVRWVPWRILDRSSASVSLSCMLYPQPAYPFAVAITVEYRLVEEGLVVRTMAENKGVSSAPFGLGFHNYLHAGDEMVDRCRLRIPARQHLVMDDRMLPRAVEAIVGSRLSVLAEARPGLIGDLVLDDCLTALEVDSDGRWRARFVPSGGIEDAVTLWADGQFGYVTVYSGDTLVPHDRRRGLAVEPMTCPPNALRSGDSLVVLGPGEQFGAQWGLLPARLGR